MALKNVLTKSLAYFFFILFTTVLVNIALFLQKSII